MKKSLLLTSLCMGAALASQSALADVKVRAGVGSSTYTLGGDYIHAKSNYNPTNVGLTLSDDSGLYFDAAYSGGTGKHDGWAALGQPAEPFKRSDLALTVGSVMMDNSSGIAGAFYVGYKTGTTTLGAQNTGLAWTEETFDSSGFIFGGGASFPVSGGSAGSIGVNLGLGLMGATWKDTTGFNVKAKTAVGFSFGASYTFPITPSFGIVGDYKYNSYSYNFGTTTLPFTVTEKVSTLGASLYAKF